LKTCAFMAIWSSVSEAAEDAAAAALEAAEEAEEAALLSEVDAASALVADALAYDIERLAHPHATLAAARAFVTASSAEYEYCLALRAAISAAARIPGTDAAIAWAALEAWRVRLAYEAASATRALKAD
jgi:hypothetical protein